MTIIDYLLLAGFVAAAVYTIYRLFLGWLNSRSNELQTNRAEEATSGGAPMSTGAPWQPRNSTERRNR
ncbi:MAG: hypothetical protein DMF06_06155 [Verrucomicrobia bacterium]|nr:MAG: hypothetical protein DMF06_06155 [Verrucomicrobiota bacterium]